MVTKQLIHGFVRFWRVDDSPIDVSPDVIVALSYGTRREVLTNGSRQSLLRAIQYFKEFPSATLAFANSLHCFPGSAIAEEKFKFQISDGTGVPRSSIISCGPVVNTVTEAEAICKALKASGKKFAQLMVVTGTMHARSARYIWLKTLNVYFPSAKLSISVFPYEYEYQKDHPLFFQRGPLRWVIGNIARQAVLRIFGMRIAARIYDPASG